MHTKAITSYNGETALKELAPSPFYFEYLSCLYEKNALGLMKFHQRLFKILFVCFDSLYSSQQFFSHVRMGLPGSNQY